MTAAVLTVDLPAGIDLPDHPLTASEVVTLAYKLAAHIVGRTLQAGDPSPCCGPYESLKSLDGCVFCPNCGHLTPTKTLEAVA